MFSLIACRARRAIIGSSQSITPAIYAFSRTYASTGIRLFRLSSYIRSSASSTSSLSGRGLLGSHQVRPMLKESKGSLTQVALWHASFSTRRSRIASRSPVETGTAPTMQNSSPPNLAITSESRTTSRTSTIRWGTGGRRVRRVAGLSHWTTDGGRRRDSPTWGQCPFATRHDERADRIVNSPPYIARFIRFETLPRLPAIDQCAEFIPGRFDYTLQPFAGAGGRDGVVRHSYGQSQRSIFENNVWRQCHPKWSMAAQWLGSWTTR